MCLSFGADKKKSSSSSTQNLVPWVSQAGQANLALANRLSDPFLQDTPTERIASFNDDQLNSFDMTRNYAAQSNPVTANDLGWSYYRGFADRGPYTMGREGGIPSMQAAQIGGAPAMQAASVGHVADVNAQKFTDADINAYMNPYTNQVVDASMADLGQKYARTLSASGLQQAAGGAFGGGRHGIREAQVADDYLRTVGSTSSNLRNQAFNNAAGLIQGDQNRALQAAQGNQQAGLQRAIQQAQMQQEANRTNTDWQRNRALEQARLNQQTNSTNANLTMTGRQADMDSRYRSDQQRMGAVQSMADATARAQQLDDQRILQNAELLAQIGGQQQQQKQAKLDVPFDLAQWRANILASTPFPTLTNSQSKSSSIGVNMGFRP